MKYNEIDVFTAKYNFEINTKRYTEFQYHLSTAKTILITFELGCIKMDAVAQHPHTYIYNILYIYMISIYKAENKHGTEDPEKQHIEECLMKMIFHW